MLTVAYRLASRNGMQRHAPTVFSDPVTDIADLYLVPTIPADSDAMIDLAGEAAATLGYAAA
jgi:hypothetical protein